MTRQPNVPRRNVLISAGGVALAAAVAGTVHADTSDHSGKQPSNPKSESSHREKNPVTRTYRPLYHHSVPDNWKNDPQRPIYVNREYLYYYLYNADYIDGGPGTAWRLATTSDHVTFTDVGVAIPRTAMRTATAGPAAWSSIMTTLPVTDRAR